MSRILEGQVALVTGGSRGIGRSICEQLAKDGAFVYVNYSSGSAAADETVKLCQVAGGQAESIGFDVANPESVEQAFEKIKTKSGRIDILVNNAGISIDGLFVRFKNEDWDKVLKINLYGAFHCSQAAAKIMMKQRYGRIVNISSVVGEMGNAGQAAYVSSKAGLIGFTKSLAKELASRNITINAVTPGFIETDMTGNLDAKVREEHLKHIPLGKYGQAADVANLVSFLSGPNSSYITGQVVGVNGGMYM